MIDFIFTLDYEIYGNGTGSLTELVYEPAENLRRLFDKWNARFVAFVEVAEFEKIDQYRADSAIDLVQRQIFDLHRDGHEIALHLHPQWSHARYAQGLWHLDAAEYNLCTLSRERISEIVEGSLDYLRSLVQDPGFTPLAFRAGNWLFQPTRTAASVLAKNGIRVDSSVFKGGAQRSHRLDYRPAMANGDYWLFSDNVNEPNEEGPWIEFPIYTEMVPFWRMSTGKRLGMNGGLGMAGQSTSRKLNRMRDLARFRYPLKLDFCRMTLRELTSMVDNIVRTNHQEGSCLPVVAIGHTKDLVDLHTVDALLAYLHERDITVSTFADVYPKLQRAKLGSRNDCNEVTSTLAGKI